MGLMLATHAALPLMKAQGSRHIVNIEKSDLILSIVELRRARMVERLGYFIRFMIGGMKLGSYATISVHQLPEAQQQRLDGRKSGYR